MHKLPRYSILLMLCVITIGCAGFRGGWESAAYVGDALPAALAESKLRQEAGERTLDLPGMKLQVKIDNTLYTLALLTTNP